MCTIDIGKGFINMDFPIYMQILSYTHIYIYAHIHIYTIISKPSPARDGFDNIHTYTHNHM